MSIIQDVFKLHFSVRAFLISYIVIMPFWYFEIYYFNSKFFLESPPYITVVLAFCITTASLLIWCLNASLIYHRQYKLHADDKAILSNRDALFEVAIISCFFIIMMLSVLTGLHYFSSIGGLHDLLLVFFLSSIVFTGIAIIRYLMMAKKLNKQFKHSVKIHTDGSGNNYIESDLGNNEAVRISLIEKGWTGGKCIRINIRDEHNHIRPGAEIPMDNILEVGGAIKELIKH